MLAEVGENGVSVEVLPEIEVVLTESALIGCFQRWGEGGKITNGGGIQRVGGEEGGNDGGSMV